MADVRDLRALEFVLDSEMSGLWAIKSGGIMREEPHVCMYDPPPLQRKKKEKICLNWKQTKAQILDVSARTV